MGCRRMLGVEDRVAIMAGVNAGLSQTRIAHLIGRSPSVVCRQIARHTDPDRQYRDEEAGRTARAARRRPKKRLLDCDEVLRRRVIADLSQGAQCLAWILLSMLTARSVTSRSTRGAIQPAIPSLEKPRPPTVWSPPWRRPAPPAGPLGHEQHRQLGRVTRSLISAGVSRDAPVKHQRATNARETGVATTKASRLVDTHHEPSPGIILNHREDGNSAHAHTRTGRHHR